MSVPTGRTSTTAGARTKPCPPDELDDWLRRCEGFRVRSREGHLGFVETVDLEAVSGRPRALAVRAGRIIVLVVPVVEVEGVFPDEQLVVLGPYTAEYVADVRTERILLVPLETGEIRRAA